jgi:hypothetical protein
MHIIGFKCMCTTVYIHKFYICTYIYTRIYRDINIDTALNARLASLGLDETGCSDAEFGGAVTASSNGFFGRFS